MLTFHAEEDEKEYTKDSNLTYQLVDSVEKQPGFQVTAAAAAAAVVAPVISDEKFKD